MEGGEGSEGGVRGSEVSVLAYFGGVQRASGCGRWISFLRRCVSLHYGRYLVLCVCVYV